MLRACTVNCTTSDNAPRASSVWAVTKRYRPKCNISFHIKHLSMSFRPFLVFKCTFRVAVFGVSVLFFCPRFDDSKQQFLFNRITIKVQFYFEKLIFNVIYTILFIRWIVIFKPFRFDIFS